MLQITILVVGFLMFCGFGILLITNLVSEINRLRNLCGEAHDTLLSVAKHGVQSAYDVDEVLDRLSDAELGVAWEDE